MNLPNYRNMYSHNIWSAFIRNIICKFYSLDLEGEIIYTFDFDKEDLVRISGFIYDLANRCPSHSPNLHTAIGFCLMEVDNYMKVYHKEI